MSLPMIAPMTSVRPDDPRRFALPQADLATLLHQTPLPPPINVPALIERCMDNETFALALLAEFESTGQERMANIRRSVANADFAAIEWAAHALTGVAGMLDAERLCELAAALDAAARDRDLTRVASLAEQLQAEMQRCLLEIPHIRAGSQSP